MACNVSEYRLGNLTFSIEQEKLQTLHIFIVMIIIQVNGLDFFLGSASDSQKVHMFLVGK